VCPILSWPVPITKNSYQHQLNLSCADTTQHCCICSRLAQQLCLYVLCGVLQYSVHAICCGTSAKAVLHLKPVLIHYGTRNTVVCTQYVKAVCRGTLLCFVVVWFASSLFCAHGS
jgi:hypothetical protein